MEFELEEGDRHLEKLLRVTAPRGVVFTTGKYTCNDKFEQCHFRGDVGYHATKRCTALRDHTQSSCSHGRPPEKNSHLWHRTHLAATPLMCAGANHVHPAPAFWHDAKKSLPKYGLAYTIGSAGASMYAELRPKMPTAGSCHGPPEQPGVIVLQLM